MGRTALLEMGLRFMRELRTAKKWGPPKRIDWIHNEMVTMIAENYFSVWRESGEVARYLTKNMPGHGRWRHVTPNAAAIYLRKYVSFDSLVMRILKDGRKRVWIHSQAFVGEPDGVRLE